MVPTSSIKKKPGSQTCKQSSKKPKTSTTIDSKKSKSEPKILKGKKFYLDVKDSSLLKKTETRLKAFGAIVEIFLSKEVQYVLTDCQGWKSRVKKNLDVSPSPSSSSSCSWISPSTVKTDSPDDGLTKKKTRSRVEAMLEKARLQPQQICAADPLQLAITWKIPVHSIDSFFRWLNRKLTTLLGTNSKYDKKSYGVRALKGVYLKIEPSNKLCRPHFKEFDEWPSINFDSDPELTPFETSKQKKKLRSAKSSQNQNDKKTSENKTMSKVSKEVTVLAGYCEICSQRYCDLNEHVASLLHVKNTSDKTEFAALDELIKAQGVESLLRDMCPTLTVSTATSCRRTPRRGVKDLHSPSSLPPLSPSMGSKQSRPSLSSPVLTNGFHATRSTSRLLHESENCKEPLQVQCNGIEHGDEGAKSDSVLVGGGRGSLSLRSMRSVSSSCPGSTKDLSCRARSQRNHWGLLSTAENENKNSSSSCEEKSRYSKRDEGKAKRLSGEEKLLEDNRSYYKVEVLNTKLRSAGNLSNDSNSDHFERTKDSTKSVDGKEPVVVRFHKVRRTELSLLSNEAENFMFGEPKRSTSETSSDGENDAPHQENGDCKAAIKCDINKKHLKRRSHAEAFIHDNLDYYKFEIQSSRLRFNHNYSNLCKEEIKNEYDDNSFECNMQYNKNFIQAKDEKDCERIPPPIDSDYKKITFSFEVERNNELWLQPFIRQDNLEEDAYPADLYTYNYRVLPFERPKLKVSKVKFSTAASKSLLSSRNGANRFKNQTFIDDGRPRKSPRCHASTLAILSTFTNRRKSKDSPDKSKEELYKAHQFLTDDENTRSSLIESVDLNEDSENVEETLKKFNDEISKLCASNSLNDKYHKAVSILLKTIETNPINSSVISAKLLAKSLKFRKSKSIEDISSFIPSSVCVDIDPSILTQEEEIPIDFSMRPGPISDLSCLVTNSAFCCSMDRVNTELSNRTIDFLRAFNNFESSCNSSDCGASSTCEMLGFMEDGRSVTRKRKRKRPNLTGWPLRNPKRKVLPQTHSNFCCTDKSKDEHSVVVESSFNDKKPLIYHANNYENLSEKSILDIEKKAKYLNQHLSESADSEDSSESCVNKVDRSNKYNKYNKSPSASASVRNLRSSSSGVAPINSSPKKQSILKKHPKKRKKWSVNPNKKFR